MKTLIAVLMLSAQSLNVLADESPRPEAVLLDALANLKPQVLETLVVEASSANASRCGS